MSDKKGNLDDNDSKDNYENDKVNNNANSSTTPKVCKGLIDAVYEGEF